MPGRVPAPPPRGGGRAPPERGGGGQPPRRTGAGETPMINVLRVGHATFTTPDLERQGDYYAAVMGLSVTEGDNSRAFLATRTGLEAIALERGDKPELTRLSFQVAPDADFSV